MTEQLLSVADLIDRTFLNPLGLTRRVLDVRLDPCTGTYELRVAAPTTDGGTDPLTVEHVTSLCGWSELATAGATRGTAASVPFTPEDIFVSDGRFFHHGIDITHKPIAFRCPQDHTWWETLAVRTSSEDIGCPTCFAEQLDQGRRGNRPHEPRNRHRRGSKQHKRKR